MNLLPSAVKKEALKINVGIKIYELLIFHFIITEKVIIKDYNK